MINRLRDITRLSSSTLTADRYKTAVRLGQLSMVVLVGLTLTGAWQFFAHEPNPAWYNYAGGT